MGELVLESVSARVRGDRFHHITKAQLGRCARPATMGRSRKADGSDPFRIRNA